MKKVNIKDLKNNNYQLTINGKKIGIFKLKELQQVIENSK